MRSQTINFSAGPAALPTAVLERARDELLDYRGSGASIMELSHRGELYAEVHGQALSLVRSLLQVPDSHDIVLMQGGATGFFGLIPLNFVKAGQSADYVMTGAWSDKALAEAQKLGAARAAGTGKIGDHYISIPEDSELQLDPNAAYLHYTANNTIVGTQFHRIPSSEVPLVSDMSSEIMSRPLEIDKFGLIYAGAQKNLGPSGAVLVIVDKAWLARSRTDLPTIFRIQAHAAKNSLLHTPPTFTVYLIRCVLEWIQEQGGVSAMESRNREKARLIYHAIDDSDGYYRAKVRRKARSLMNISFGLPSPDLERSFLSEAEQAGMIGLKGHRSVGGIRASLYNAISLEGTARLAEFMNAFRGR